MVGSRQSSYPPVRHADAPATACRNVFFAPGSFCHIRPVARSVTVPSPLSRYAGAAVTTWASWPKNGSPGRGHAISPRSP